MKYIGFVILWSCYHLAESSMYYANNAIGFLLGMALFFVCAWQLPKHRGLSSWGLGLHKGWWKMLLSGMLIGFVLYGLQFTLAIYWRSEQLVKVPSWEVIVPQLAYWSLGTALSSFSEDILTRGYVYHYYKNTLSPTWLVIASALLYWFNHIHRLTDDWVTFGYLFVLGVLLMIPLVKTQSLWVTGGIHWAGNIFFHLSHSIAHTQEVPHSRYSSNILLIFCIIVLIPIVGVLPFSPVKKPKAMP